MIDASKMIVVPGLVDTHRHLWESILGGTAVNFSLMEYLQQILAHCHQPSVPMMCMPRTF